MSVPLRLTQYPDPREALDSAGFEIRLFGPMEVRVGGSPLPRLRSRKGMWLLALLALRAGRDVDRTWLAGTLWPDCEEEDARRSLRQSLHDLRAALGPEAWRLQSNSPRTLRLDLDGATVDTLTCDRLAAHGDRRSLQECAELLRGALLEGCAEEWVADERRRREGETPVRASDPPRSPPMELSPVTRRVSWRRPGGRRDR